MDVDVTLLAGFLKITRVLIKPQLIENIKSGHQFICLAEASCNIGTDHDISTHFLRSDHGEVAYYATVHQFPVAYLNGGENGRNGHTGPYTGYNMPGIQRYNVAGGYICSNTFKG